jgi:HlyD family secretion protein
MEKMASPERLDVMMRVTSPAGWLAIATIGVVLLGVLLWSVLGAIPTRVAGQGILTAGTYFLITASAEGVLTDLKIEGKEFLEANEIVAVITQLSAQEQLRNAEESYRRLQQDYDISAIEWSRSIQTLDGLIRSDKSRIRELEARLDNPNYPRRRTQEQIDNFNRQIAGNAAQKQRVQESQRSMLRRVEDAKNKYETLQVQIGGSSILRSTVAGRVLEVPVRQGDRIRPGTVVARVLHERKDGAYEAKFFIGSAEGAQIAKGMPVEVAPSTVKREEFGYIKGSVVRRSEATLAKAQLERELVDEVRVQKILKLGPVYMVTAELTAADTPTRLEWSSGSGPPEGSLGDNMDISVNVITRTRRPYSLVIPAVKKVTGLS